MMSDEGGLEDEVWHVRLNNVRSVFQTWRGDSEPVC